MRNDELEIYQLWRREGVACLETLFARQEDIGKNEQTIGLELRDHWDAALPLLVAALQRGGQPNVLRIIYYLDGDDHGELIARCHEPSLAFPADRLAAWCRPLGTTEHPEARAQLARLRRHRSRQVRIAATAHDPDYCTAARAIELLDEHPDDAPIEHIAELRVRSNDVLAEPDVQAAVVRLLERRRDVLRRSSSMECYYLTSLACVPSPALTEWLKSARADAELHAGIVKLVEHHPVDVELLQHIADTGAPEPARRARGILARDGTFRGRFLDISGHSPRLCPDVIELDVAEVGRHFGGMPVQATIVCVLAKTLHVGVTFDYDGDTWCACLALRGYDRYRPAYVWTEVAKLADATSGELGTIANARRARDRGDLDAIHVPGPLAAAIDGLSGDRAVDISMRLHGALDNFEPLVAPIVYANALRAAQLQLFGVLMTAARYDDAIVVGGVIGPMHHARALAAAGRHADALDALADSAKTPDAVKLERECRDALARQKQARALAIGVAVTHAKFGTGTVLAVVGEGATQKAKVRFATGERMLAATFLDRC